MNSSVQRVFFRSFMRMARSLIRSNTALWLQTFPAPEEFQRFKKSDANDEFIKSLVWFPDGISARLANRDLITDRLVDGKLMRSVLYGLFRQIKYDSVALDEAFSCLKAMNTLVKLSKCSSVTTTKGIRVIATAVYDKIGSNTSDGHVFYYRIVIENHRTSSIQVLGRHWIMRTAAEENEVPRYAPAIVGEKPELSPGESFTYMSMTPAMKHSEGSIQGAFLVRDCVSGESIEAEVGLFNMDFRVHNEYHHHSV